MDILILIQNIPYPVHRDGASLPNYYLLKSFKDAGYRVTLLVVEKKEKNAAVPEEIRRLCHRVISLPYSPGGVGGWIKRFIAAVLFRTEGPIKQKLINKLVFLWHGTEEVQSTVARILDENDYDLILNELFYCIYAYSFRIPKVIICRDNLTLLFTRIGAAEKSLRGNFYHFLKKILARNYEKFYYPKYDRCVFVSENDAAFARQLTGGNNFTVITNGVDLTKFTPNRSKINPFDIVFTGVMDYPPNIDAARYFAGEILPRVKKAIPRARFLIVGRNPVRAVRELADGDNVIVTGEVEDIREFVWQAAVYACPLRTGTGVKNKILEAMAMGKAIVTTSIGIEGINVIPEEHVLLADTPAEFACHIINLFGNYEERERLEDAAYKQVTGMYSWENNGRQYTELIEDLVESAKKYKI